MAGVLLNYPLFCPLSLSPPPGSSVPSSWSMCVVGWVLQNSWGKTGQDNFQDHLSLIFQCCFYSTKNRRYRDSVHHSPHVFSPPFIWIRTDIQTSPGILYSVVLWQPALNTLVPHSKVAMMHLASPAVIFNKNLKGSLSNGTVDGLFRGLNLIHMK